MGATCWSDHDYSARATYRAKTSTPTFAHDADVRSGRAAAKVHDKLSPHGVKVRESRDSTTHPESNAVAVLCDVTGSMSTVPQIVQKNLPKLMGLLLRKAYLTDPAIMVGAIGDATCDRAALQVGQFESGIEIENDLTNLYLEGGGGGHITESYELAMYFMARHTAIDCLEKRSKRGYLFIIGDEQAYNEVSASQVKSIIGDTLQSNIKTTDIVAELKRMYDVYYILPNMTSHYNDDAIFSYWSKLLGQNTLRLPEPEAICELIASTIGLAEGRVDMSGIARDLDEYGSKSAARAVDEALMVYAKNSPGALVSVPDSGAGSGIATL